jgi:hypothetical protein
VRLPACRASKSRSRGCGGEDITGSELHQAENENGPGFTRRIYKIDELNTDDRTANNL